MHRLAYSFGWDGSEEVPPGSSLVEIDLMEQPPDGTLLRLTHTGLVKAGLALDPTFTIRRLKSATVSDDPAFREQGRRVIQGMRIAGVPEG